MYLLVPTKSPGGTTLTSPYSKDMMFVIISIQKNNNHFFKVKLTWLLGSVRYRTTMGTRYREKASGKLGRFSWRNMAMFGTCSISSARTVGSVTSHYFYIITYSSSILNKSNTTKSHTNLHPQTSWQPFPWHWWSHFHYHWTPGAHPAIHEPQFAWK